MNGGTFSGTSLSYSFDAAGRLRQRTGASTITRYLYAGSGASLFDTTTSGTIQNTSVNSPAGDLAHYLGAPQTGTTTEFLYYTGHGDLAATADPAGIRQNTYSYDPYGTLQQAPPANTSIERWTGRWDKRLDTTSTLIQMGARPYDPALGRFLAVDPIDGGSLNTYDYAGQEPIGGYDLDGKLCVFSWSCMKRKARRLANVLARCNFGAICTASHYGTFSTTICFYICLGGAFNSQNLGLVWGGYGSGFKSGRGAGFGATILYTPGRPPRTGWFHSAGGCARIACLGESGGHLSVGIGTPGSWAGGFYYKQLRF
jgi:RHS repeat-associated protein